MQSLDRNILSYPYDACSGQDISVLKTFYRWAKPLVDRSVQEAIKLGQASCSIDLYFPSHILPELFDVIFVPI